MYYLKTKISFKGFEIMILIKLQVKPIGMWVYDPTEVVNPNGSIQDCHAVAQP
jgi:hypothetical protein